MIFCRPVSGLNIHLTKAEREQKQHRPETAILFMCVYMVSERATSISATEHFGRSYQFVGTFTTFCGVAKSIKYVLSQPRWKTYRR